MIAKNLLYGKDMTVRPSVNLLWKMCIVKFDLKDIFK